MEQFGLDLSCVAGTIRILTFMFTEVRRGFLQLDSFGMAQSYVFSRIEILLSYCYSKVFFPNWIMYKQIV